MTESSHVHGLSKSAEATVLPVQLPPRRRAKADSAVISPPKGVSSEWCNSWVGCYRWVAVRRPSKAMSKAWRAGFHRLVQRFAPFPVGSRLMTAR